MFTAGGKTDQEIGKLPNLFSYLTYLAVIPIVTWGRARMQKMVIPGPAGIWTLKHIATVGGNSHVACGESSHLLEHIN